MTTSNITELKVHITLDQLRRIIEHSITSYVNNNGLVYTNDSYLLGLLPEWTEGSHDNG